MSITESKTSQEFDVSQLSQEVACPPPSESTGDPTTPRVTGECKWFSAPRGYGFISIQSGPDAGQEIFVHHSGLKTSNTQCFRTLWEREPLTFTVTQGPKGRQAIDVCGKGEGPLLCDRPTESTAGAPSYRSRIRPVSSAGPSTLQVGRRRGPPRHRYAEMNDAPIS